MWHNPLGASKGSEGIYWQKTRKRKYWPTQARYRLWLHIGYCIFVKAFCFDESTSAFIVLTILSRSSFIFWITALNIPSIISFIESVLATGVSCPRYSLAYFYTFLSLYIWSMTPVDHSDVIRTILFGDSLRSLFLLFFYWKNIVEGGNGSRI